MQRIDVTELKRRLDAGNSCTLLDVREHWEYEICQIPGSINLPMSQILNRQEELDKDAVTVVICHHGVRSSQACMYLINSGFEHITNLSGGIDAWSSVCDSSVPRY